MELINGPPKPPTGENKPDRDEVLKGIERAANTRLSRQTRARLRSLDETSLGRILNERQTSQLPPGAGVAHMHNPNVQFMRLGISRDGDNISIHYQDRVIALSVPDNEATAVVNIPLQRNIPAPRVVEPTRVEHRRENQRIGLHWNSPIDTPPTEAGRYVAMVQHRHGVEVQIINYHGGREEASLPWAPYHAQQILLWSPVPEGPLPGPGMNPTLE